MTPIHRIQHHSPAGTGDAESLAPPPRSGDLDSDITDEFTDHLALSARDLQLAGHAAEDANKLAHQHFGDVAAIRRRLWWIHQGEEVMLRTALAIVCAVLVLAVAALGIGNWRMSQTVDDLHTTLATMNENQKKVTEAQDKFMRNVNRPLTIRGRVYLGDRSKPAPRARVDLYRHSDRRLIDQHVTDRDGRFETGSLPSGKYFVVAPLLGLNPNSEPFRGLPTASSRFGRSSKTARSASRFAFSQSPDARPLFGFQSELLEMSPFAEDSEVELNVEMIPIGQVSFDPPKVYTSFDLTEPERPMAWTNFDSALVARLRGNGVELPDKIWPVLQIAMIKQGPGIPDLRTRDAEQPPVGAGVYNGRFRRIQGWRADSLGYKEILFFEQFGSGDNFAVSLPGRYRLEAYLALMNTRDALTATVGDDAESPERFRRDQPRLIEVKEDQRTHVRLTPPVDFEAEVKEALYSVSNQEEFGALLDRMWPVNIEEVRFEEMVIPPEVIQANQRRLERVGK